jgi:hypothetical protein
MARLIPESLRKDLDQNGPSFPLPPEHGARQGQAAVLLPAIPVSPRRSDTLAFHGKEVRGRDDSQVGILRDVASPSLRAFGEISSPLQLLTGTGILFELSRRIINSNPERVCTGKNLYRRLSQEKLLIFHVAEPGRIIGISFDQYLFEVVP